MTVTRWLGVAAGVAAFTATGALALAGHGGARASAPGPEGVAIPNAPALAPPRVLADGARIDGIVCQAREQLLFHIHAHLTIFVRGKPRRVPAGIGIAQPWEVQQTPVGAFVVAAPCFMWLHTHAADGIIHTESPISRRYTLGDFFDIWGRRLDGGHVGPDRGRVTAFVDGRVFTGNVRKIPLLAHAQIQLDVGRPLVRPERITFPPGL